jgi:hypothetical protein
MLTELVAVSRCVVCWVTGWRTILAARREYRLEAYATLGDVVPALPRYLRQNRVGEFAEFPAEISVHELVVFLIHFQQF